MPNIATLLKNEISRVARKEQRGESLAVKKALSSHRTEIAALKRRTQALEQALRRLTRAGGRSSAAQEADDAPAPSTRFSAKSLASQRRRLGLSAADCGLLVGTTAQSIYNWEAGKVRPRDRHLAAIAALRTLGRKDAAAHLAARQAKR
ncbi:MAG: helix-turn-helix transcriptional regulator [Caldimonas sp.]